MTGSKLTAIRSLGAFTETAHGCSQRSRRKLTCPHLFVPTQPPNIAAIALAILSLGTPALAQSDGDGRQVKTKVAPTYPELARSMNISGKVKLQVVVSPDGHVKSTNGIGGHPILIQACQDAVMKWRFFPSPVETTQVIEFEFHYR